MNAKTVCSASLHLKQSMCSTTSFVSLLWQTLIQIPCSNNATHVAVTFQIKATINKKYRTFVTDNRKHTQKWQQAQKYSNWKKEVKGNIFIKGSGV